MRLMKIETFRWYLFCFLALAFANPVPVSAGTDVAPGITSPHKHILILHTYAASLPAYQKVTPAFLSVMSKAGISGDDLFLEYPNLLRWNDGESRRRLVDQLRYKYADKKIDLIVTLHGTALEFLLTDGKDLFPETPVLSYLSPSETNIDKGRHPLVTLTFTGDFRRTLAQALKLFPLTERVMVVCGTAPGDRAIEEVARRGFAPWQGKLAFEYASGGSFEEMKHRAATLPPHSIIIYGNVFSDTTGRNFVPKEVAHEIAKVANAPVFAYYDTVLGEGIVGGALLSFAAEGERAARVALDMLSGKLSPSQQATTLQAQTTPMYDWQQLLRWGGSPDRLPEGAVFIKRPPSLWRDYRGAVLAAGGIITLLLSLVTALLVQKHRVRAAMQSLSRSEERFRVLVEQAPEAILVYDVDRQLFTDANQNAERLFGCSREELLKFGPQRFYPDTQPDGRPPRHSMAEHNEQALAGETVSFERVVRTEEGREKICEINLVRFPSEGKRLIRASMIDITARRQAENKLRVSERIARKFSILFHAAPFAMALVSTPEGVLYDVNLAWLELAGFKEKEEVIGKPGAELELLPEAESRERLLNEFVQHGVVRNMEVATCSKAGDQRALLVNMNRVDIGEHHFVLWSIQDITELRRAEEALHRSELKFSKIFHSVPALITITTMPEGRCVDMNEAGLKTLGYRREEIVGRTMLELGLWEDTTIRDRVLNGLEKDGSVRDFELDFTGKNVGPFTGLLSVEPIDFDGTRYLLGMVNDITERKRMEVEIERLNSDLAARAADLERTNLELEAFNYTVAHDLRRPLTAVSGCCDVIRELYVDEFDAEGKGFLQGLHDGIWRMNQLINTLLEFSRLTHVKLHHEPVDLTGVVQAVAAELQLAEPARRAAFSITEGVSVVGDANLLRVAMENLLGNAWKYTGEREEAVIEFGVIDTEGHSAMFVRDNGSGFAMADAAKLFIPFQRLHQSTAFEGHGIGLATVQRIVQRHGGQVWAEGEPGKGATFYFTLDSFHC